MLTVDARTNERHGNVFDYNQMCCQALHSRDVRAEALLRSAVGSVLRAVGPASQCPVFVLVGNDLVGLDAPWFNGLDYTVCILTRDLEEFTVLHQVLQWSLLSIIILIITTTIIVIIEHSKRLSDFF